MFQEKNLVCSKRATPNNSLAFSCKPFYKETVLFPWERELLFWFIQVRE